MQSNLRDHAPGIIQVPAPVVITVPEHTDNSRPQRTPLFKKHPQPWHIPRPKMLQREKREKRDDTVDDADAVSVIYNPIYYGGPRDTALKKSHIYVSVLNKN